MWAYCDTSLLESRWRGVIFRLTGGDFRVGFLFEWFPFDGFNLSISVELAKDSKGLEFGLVGVL